MSQPLDRAFALEAVRITESAARAASAHVGRGDEHAADLAAIGAMRAAFDILPISGTVIIGEGERDEAPKLYAGETVGSGGIAVDLALDPLEGTTLTAKALPNALAVLAMAEPGTLLDAPAAYMDKIAIGPGYPEGTVDLDAAPADNVRALAAAKGVAAQDLTVCILDRPRHDDIVEQVRQSGAAIRLIEDGDVAAIIATTDPSSGIDLYLGCGGAPEGVLAAAALRCTGGSMQARLRFRNDEERRRAKRHGIDDLTRKYELTDLASGDVIFAATGVTDGAMLRGVRRVRGYAHTESVVMRATSGTIRYIRSSHRLRPDEA